MKKFTRFWISTNNSKSFIATSSKHVTNINRALKKIKSKVMADFIWKDHRELIITTKKVAANSDFNTIENYIKNIDIVDFEDIMSPRLPQSKSYLKILGIYYYIEDINILITSDIVEKVIQTTHIFNDTILAFCPHIIKASSKPDIDIIWINIWNSQSGSKAKNLINRCFNIGSNITMIWNMNMNSGVLQWKNCWRWGHTTFTCYVHGSKYIKYNGPHKAKCHWEMV